MSNIFREEIQAGDTIKVTTWDQGVLVERSGVVGDFNTLAGVISTQEGGILWNGAWAGKFSFNLIDRPKLSHLENTYLHWPMTPPRPLENGVPERDKESPEAEWSMTETEFKRELENAREEGRAEAKVGLDFQYRLAALQQSVAYWGEAPGRTSPKAVNVAQTFETFLRDGKRI